jgi:hypothetical protein
MKIFFDTNVYIAEALLLREVGCPAADEGIK